MYHVCMFHSLNLCSWNATKVQWFRGWEIWLTLGTSQSNFFRLVIVLPEVLSFRRYLDLNFNESLSLIVTCVSVVFGSLIKPIMSSTWCAGVATLCSIALQSFDSSGWLQNWLKLGRLVTRLLTITTDLVLSLFMSAMCLAYRQSTVGRYHL